MATKKGKVKAETGTSGLTPLKKVCADLGIEANCATRAKLRREWRAEDGRIKPDEHKLKHRWDLSASQVKRVKEILAVSAE